VNRIQHNVAYVSLVVGLIVAWLFLSVLGLLDGLEQEAMRWRYLLRGEKTSSAPIVYVDLDAESVASIGARPWDRANFAVVLRALLGPGEAQAVGVDIIFSQIGRGSLLDLERAKAGDVALGDTIKKYPDQIVLAAAYTGTIGPNSVPLIRLGFSDPKENVFPESPSFPIIDWEVGRLGLANVDEVLGKGVVPHWVVGFVETDGEWYSRVLMAGMRNHFYEMLREPLVVEKSKTFALTDKDGWTPQEIPRFSNKVIYSLGFEVFLASHGLNAEHVRRSEDRLLIYKDNTVFREVPLVGQQSIEVNWFEGWQTRGATEHVSLQTVRVKADALSQAAESGDREAVARGVAWFKRFKDKIIFVGPVDPQLKDVAPTPFNREPVPKVALHANLLRTIESSEYVTRASALESSFILISLTIGVAFLMLWSGFGRSASRYGAVALILFYLCLVFGAFSYSNLVLPIIAPVGASVCAALSLVLIKLGVEEWERRRLKNLFGAYLSPELVDQMVEAERDPELGGIEAEISALFTDLEGFSSVAEELSPDQLVALMNEYLSAMTEVIQSEGGTLDKYIGDAIVTMFGMPLPLDDHAARACVAAQRMQECHASLREEWAASERWPAAVLKMRTRIGINTGAAVVGNMGSRVRFNYTMMGDSVNMAARCESAAKMYGVYTMVTESTLDAARKVNPELLCRQLDKIIVKGKTKPVGIYELLANGSDSVRWLKCKASYEAGLVLYFEQRWMEALAAFEESLSHELFVGIAKTSPSEIMIARCRQFGDEGRPSSWDGVYRMQAK